MITIPITRGNNVGEILSVRCDFEAQQRSPIDRTLYSTYLCKRCRIKHANTAQLANPFFVANLAHRAAIALAWRERARKVEADYLEAAAATAASPPQTAVGSSRVLGPRGRYAGVAALKRGSTRRRGGMSGRGGGGRAAKGGDDGGDVDVSACIGNATDFECKAAQHEGRMTDTQQ